MTPDAPLILTLAIDEPSFAFFQAQRQRHFPPERNHIPAHLTLFHKLPADKEGAVLAAVAEAAAAQPPFPLEVTGLRSLGRGVAYTLASPTLAQLRLGLARQWALWLTLQDRQKHQPHITVQNKVDPEQARALLTRLQAAFTPFTIEAEGLHLWRYRGGPWEHLRTCPFTPAKA
ncbi:MULTISPECIES: 2'-5' RNA ligase family protein [Microvirga]|uniref:2'-5' RNA ligase family protein n=1 Tax=Microvirga TaxID=186650 RepID=UPI001CFEDDE2|nr:2'-5' RNA ligase family protein [Microvirga lenta]MCB5174457.1 2'-5' RNA ligase family protein [Microvirga lenta]